jgi:enoyl-CoA hydratase/carnithine racemase
MLGLSNFAELDPMSLEIKGAETPRASLADAEPCLLREDRGKVALLTLNRPQSRNSLSVEMLNALLRSIGDISAARQVSAVVIAAAPPAFCAGHDLRELTATRNDADGGRAFFDQVMRLCSNVMQAIVRCPKPVIAAVGGTATAAGCQLVASCDLAVAGAAARFATPGVNIGLFCSTPMVALSRNISRKHAMEMLLLGELVPAEQAREMGLVNRVVADADVLSEALEMADRIAAKSPATVAIGKEAFYQQIEMPLPDAYDYASRVMTENMLIRDAEEGIGAFLEKRTPQWEGTEE